MIQDTFDKCRWKVMHLVLLCKPTLTGDIHCQHYFALELVHLGVSAIDVLHGKSRIELGNSVRKHTASNRIVEVC